jgi:hypothetical protein
MRVYLDSNNTSKNDAQNKRYVISKLVPAVPKKEPEQDSLDFSIDFSPFSKIETIKPIFSPFSFK